jgi:hypothetical protein
MSEPVLHFAYPMDDYVAFEIRSKGWHGGAVAELPGGKLYPLTFYDPVRLSQEMASAAEAGVPCLDEVALIVVPEVTEALMRASVQRLYKIGWFDHLVPSDATTPLQALGLEASP